MATSMNDPRVLRAIAHPVRNRILTELDAVGPMRAADIAAALGIPANQASFHLRQLAKYGLVVEDPEAARDRRDRVWKRIEEISIHLEEVERQSGGAAASEVFRRTKAAWGHHLVDVAYGEDRSPGRIRSIAESPVRLTKAEAEQLAGELDAVVAAWAERTRGRGEDRSTYVVYRIVMPHPDAVAPTVAD